MTTKKPGQFRIGKTKRDHKSGAWAQRIDNQIERANWNNEKTMTRSQKNFPYHTCNGKRNRSLDNKGQPITIVGVM